MADDLIYRLRKRAEIRRSITTRKSVQLGQPDRIADLLEEAANEIERLQRQLPMRSTSSPPATTSSPGSGCAGGAPCRFVIGKVNIGFCRNHRPDSLQKDQES